MKKNARIKLEKDFVALNREAVRAGLVTEREQMKSVFEKNRKRLSLASDWPKILIKL